MTISGSTGSGIVDKQRALHRDLAGFGIDFDDRGWARMGTWRSLKSLSTINASQSVGPHAHRTPDASSRRRDVPHRPRERRLRRRLQQLARVRVPRRELRGCDHNDEPATHAGTNRQTAGWTSSGSPCTTSTESTQSPRRSAMIIFQVGTEPVVRRRARQQECDRPEQMHAQLFVGAAAEVISTYTARPIPVWPFDSTGSCAPARRAADSACVEHRHRLFVSRLV